MTLQDKLEKGSQYLLDQSEAKLKTLGTFEGAKFVPTDPKAYKKHKSNMEFRLRYVEAVGELLKDHVLLADGLLEFISRIDSNGDITEEDLEGLKKVAERFRV